MPFFSSMVIILYSLRLLSFLTSCSHSTSAMQEALNSQKWLKYLKLRLSMFHSSSNTSSSSRAWIIFISLSRSLASSGVHCLVLLAFPTSIAWMFLTEGSIYLPIGLFPTTFKMRLRYSPVYFKAQSAGLHRVIPVSKASRHSTAAGNCPLVRFSMILKLQWYKKTLKMSSSKARVSL